MKVCFSYLDFLLYFLRGQAGCTNTKFRPKITAQQLRRNVLLAYCFIILVSIFQLCFYHIPSSNSWACVVVFHCRPGIFRNIVFMQIMFYFVLEDFVFYWGHRVLHTKWLYKHVHSVHHEYATPFGLTSEYAHPAEILFLGFATIVGPAITGPHLITLWLWMVLRVLETVEAHCGYHFPWSLSNFIPLYGGADFHDYHHRLLYTKSGNYSSTFTYMDWIFGTDKGYRKLKELQHVGVGDGSKQM
ncbi:methylsterol monooxygenase 2-2 isoform X2 [Castanea sativa]|uniref:methylsterol monooxygenase 2-2 isoform X2 n=1 Tax=Castanea sativa TaxID=21020 RepID=UPI003F64EC3E